VRVYAARILELHHDRVLKRGRHLERLTSAELHRLRIAVKQLRYAVEFFSSLFSVRGMATLRDRLARLQDILGRINDAAAVDPLLRSATANGSDTAAAAGIVIGWCEAQAALERKALQLAWRRFRRTRKPWQEQA
jgi:CHAD domain-containing protein